MVEETSKSVSASLWAALSDSPSVRTSEGQPLFRYGDPGRGVYLVEQGSVELFFSSEGGRERLFEKAGPGAVLGLSEAISGGTHKLTAVASGNAQVLFVEREHLLHLLRRDPGLCMQLVRLLSENLHILYHKFQSSSGVPKASRATLRQHPPSRSERPN